MWFERLTGFPEISASNVRENMSVHGEWSSTLYLGGNC